MRLLVFILIGGGLSLAIPRSSAETLRLQPEWRTAYSSQSTVEESEPLKRSPLVIWNGERLVYIDAASGGVLARREFPHGVAYNQEFMSSGQTMGGEVHVYTNRGDPAYILRGHGQVVFRNSYPYIVGRYLDYVWAYDADGKARWETALTGTVSVVEAVGLRTVIGTASGSLWWIHDDGSIQMIRPADGRPILAVAVQGDAFWSLIGGERPELQYRKIDRPGEVADSVSLPTKSPLRSPVEIRAEGGELVVPELSVAITTFGRMYSYPSESSYFSIEESPLAVRLRQGPSDDSESRSPMRFELYDPRRDKCLFAEQLPAPVQVIPRERAFGVWNDTHAVLYRVRANRRSQ